MEILPAHRIGVARELRRLADLLVPAGARSATHRHLQQAAAALEHESM